MNLQETYESLMDLRDSLEGNISSYAFNKLDDCIDSIYHILNPDNNDEI